MTPYTPARIAELNADLESRRAEEIVAWAVETFGNEVTFACSFGAEDMVLLDLLLKARADARVFLLDTGRLHQETYDLIERARRHYGRGFTVYTPQAHLLQALLTEYGPNSFYQSVEARKACCRVRKVEPLARALADARAWLTGLRREQSVTRTVLPIVEADEAHGGILKINPLATWTEEQVWDYLRRHGVPTNDLHDRGFPSIGCAPCTRAVQEGEDVRAGRWWWESPEHKECGLHSRPGRGAASVGVME